MQNSDKWLKEQVSRYEEQAPVCGWDKTKAWERLSGDMEQVERKVAVVRMRRYLRVAVAAVVVLLLLAGGMFVRMQGRISQLNQQLYNQHKGLANLHQDLVAKEKELHKMRGQLADRKSVGLKVVEQVKWKTRTKIDTVIKIQQVYIVDTVRVDVPVETLYLAEHQEKESVQSGFLSGNTEVKERYTFELNAKPQNGDRKRIRLGDLLSAKKGSERFVVKDK